MCGGENSIRIGEAENGYTIDAYKPGGPDKPGKHMTKVATNEAGVLSIVAAHLKSKAKGRRSGMRVRGGADVASAPLPSLKKKGGKKKRMAVKR